MSLGRLIIPAIVLVFVVGAIVFRDRLSSNAGELRVGDCFQVPTGDTIKDVQHAPCGEGHDGEVMLVAKMDAGDYPSEAQFQAWVQSNCVDTGFAGYVGAPFSSREDIDVGYFTPTSEGWGKGDRTMICYLTPVDGQKVNASFKGAPAAS